LVNIVGVLVISFLHKLLVNYKEGDIMFAKIGFRIKQARINAQITQDTLAELIGCSTSFISRLECGKVSTSLETLLNISQVLNIGLEELLCDFLNLPDSVQTPTSYQILQIVNSLTPQQQGIVLQHLQGLLHWTE
jgi:transcriptional regulator with XRE-family HTH domain